MPTPPAPSRSLTRIRHRLRPWTDQLALVRAMICILSALPRRSRKQLWIGDSHSVTFLRDGTWANLLTGPGGEVILRTGPRLMHSLSRRGFPRRINRIAAFVGRAGRDDCLVPVFVNGEIDVRNSLAAHPDTDWAFVARYVSRADELRRSMGASQGHVVVPPPPSRAEHVDPSFPRTGTDQQRLLAFQELRSALRSAVAAFTAMTLIDGTEHLVDDQGYLPTTLSDDGCHLNGAGRDRIRHLMPVPGIR